jgi:hypothetical protein
MYGMIPKAKTDNCSSAPPENMLKDTENGPFHFREKRGKGNGIDSWCGHMHTDPVNEKQARYTEMRFFNSGILKIFPNPLRPCLEDLYLSASSFDFLSGGFADFVDTNRNGVCMSPSPKNLIPSRSPLTNPILMKATSSITDPHRNRFSSWTLTIA